jgi:hypothetical protein
MATSLVGCVSGSGGHSIVSICISSAERVLTNHGVVSIMYVDVVSKVSDEEMAYVRVQKRGDRRYYYLVRSERRGRKVRQKFLQYLGTSKPAKEDLDNIMGGIARNKKRGL